MSSLPRYGDRVARYMERQPNAAATVQFDWHDGISHWDGIGGSPLHPVVPSRCTPPPPRRLQVLSVGGNDARIRFLQSTNPDVIAQLMVTDGLVANLRRVIEIIRSEVTPNIILVYV